MVLASCGSNKQAAQDEVDRALGGLPQVAGLEPIATIYGAYPDIDSDSCFFGRDYVAFGTTSATEDAIAMYVTALHAQGWTSLAGNYPTEHALKQGRYSITVSNRADNIFFANNTYLARKGQYPT